MSVDGIAAARTLLNWRTCDPGLCLRYVWNAYAAHGATTGHPAVGTAYEAWEASEGKRHGDRNPPAGVPVHFGKKPGSAAGDIVISLGGGRVVATDWPRYGVIGTCTIAEREAQIGRPYLGWTSSIFDCPIQQGDEMPLNAETDYPAFRDMLFRALKWDVRANGAGPDWKLGPTIWDRLGALGAPVDYQKLAAEIVKAGGTAPTAEQIAAAVNTDAARRLAQ